MIKWTSIFLFSFLIVFSIPERFPEIGYLVEKSSEGEQQFLRQRESCDSVLNLLQGEVAFDDLKESDQQILMECDEAIDDYWDIIGYGCSWYCGGGLDTLSATSCLKSQNNISYEAKNAHDLSYKTAWVEGVEGYGIGEKLIYHFPPENPRITKVIIVNGYVKSEKVWRENSRVKKLKMYIDNEPLAILKLEDSRNEQSCDFEPIGNSNRDNWDEMKLDPWWTMTFEILEVYPGEKYDDTAITEIYFDGIDVH